MIRRRSGTRRRHAPSPTQYVQRPPTRSRLDYGRIGNSDRHPIMPMIPTRHRTGTFFGVILAMDNGQAKGQRVYDRFARANRRRMGRRTGRRVQRRYPTQAYLEGHYTENGGGAYASKATGNGRHRIAHLWFATWTQHFYNFDFKGRAGVLSVLGVEHSYDEQLTVLPTRVRNCGAPS